VTAGGFVLQPYRDIFNAMQFSPGRYAELKQRLNRRCRTDISFQICETPCFFPPALLEEMIDAGRVLTHQLLDNPDYMRRSDTAIPDRFRIAGVQDKPHFMTVDFGLVRGADGQLHPKLVELQAFPSIFGYQDVLCEEYRAVYGLAPELTPYFGGLDQASYWQMLERTIVGDHDPENVILMEIEPEGQKTLPDFHVYEDRLGVATVAMADIRQRGSKLFYVSGGREIPIRRIFNRAIVDELERKGLTPPFDYRDQLDVEWAGNPNWYFRISKFSLPFLDHPTVPPAVFLDDWFAGWRGVLGHHSSQLLLKPLYSFAGKGIQFDPSDADLAAIPEGDRHLYLLQERVHFEPVIETPDGMTQAEVRIMYLWPDGAPEMTPAISLVRLGRGLMMGVDHNRDQAWVGGSAAFCPR
jgi:hypothetical protein